MTAEPSCWRVSATRRAWALAGYLVVRTASMVVMMRDELESGSRSERERVGCEGRRVVLLEEEWRGRWSSVISGVDGE